MTAESVTAESSGLGDDGPAVHEAGSPGLGRDVLQAVHWPEVPVDTAASRRGPWDPRPLGRRANGSDWGEGLASVPFSAQFPP